MVGTPPPDELTAAVARVDGPEKPVSGDRADLARQQERPDPLGEGAHRLERGDGGVGGDQVLRLELVARARGEAHPEVR